MPRQPKVTGNRTPGETIPRQFRLSAETLADLDLIADDLAITVGITASRADAIRAAARRTVVEIERRKKKEK